MRLVWPPLVENVVNELTQRGKPLIASQHGLNFL